MSAPHDFFATAPPSEYLPSLAASTPRRRTHHPDVPTDVDAAEQEALLHFNDLNWDVHGHGSGSDTSSLSGQSFELEHKHQFSPDVKYGHSIGTGPSEFDTESRADSAYEHRSSASSRLRMRAADSYDEYEE